ncbi:MAG TPA: hypothetical protein VGK25_08050 [Ignavibacteria bacterium]|jgi:hypothetical protein
MMNIILKKILSYIFAFTILLNLSCSGVYDAIVNLQRLQFKLDKVTGLSAAGVGFSNASRLSDFSVLDAAKLLSAFTDGRLPVEFTLNVLAKNPNDGTGGTKKTSAVIKNLAWRLFLDNKETINGNIGNITVPGIGEATNIPIRMSLDLFQFFRDQGYESLINLALALGGRNGSAARVTLKATPTIETVLGPITYPGEIEIIDREFRAQ